MKKFSELGIKSGDGKEKWDCPQVSITDIINCEIEVDGFIPNMKTKQGEGRYLIHIRHEGLEKKFFTNSNNLKETLGQIKKADMPFLTTIKAEKCGNGGKYYRFT